MCDEIELGITSDKHKWFKKLHTEDISFLQNFIDQIGNTPNTVIKYALYPVVWLNGALSMRINEFTNINEAIDKLSGKNIILHTGYQYEDNSVMLKLVTL